MIFFPSISKFQLLFFGDSIDFSNAFSNVNTKAVCECERKAHTSLSKSINQTYNHQSQLYHCTYNTSIDRFYQPNIHMRSITLRTQSTIYYVLILCAAAAVAVTAIAVPCIYCVFVLAAVVVVVLYFAICFSLLGHLHSLNWYFIIVDPMSQSHKQSL